jgi:hypothetical protein
MLPAGRGARRVKGCGVGVVISSLGERLRMRAGLPETLMSVRAALELEDEHHASAPRGSAIRCLRAEGPEENNSQRALNRNWEEGEANRSVVDATACQTGEEARDSKPVPSMSSIRPPLSDSVFPKSPSGGPRHHTSRSHCPRPIRHFPLFSFPCATLSLIFAVTIPATIAA